MNQERLLLKLSSVMGYVPTFTQPRMILWNQLEDIRGFPKVIMQCDQRPHEAGVLSNQLPLLLQK